MNAPSFRRLRDLGMADVADVGGKAASLGELLAAGVRVPDGVVMTAGAAHLSPDERHALARSAAEKVGPGPYAVRSSAIGEDANEQSYAGMYESVLNVPPDQLASAVDRCLASGGAARVAEYATPGGGRMAVIIQRMVAATAAGVVLTADPVNGDRRSCVVTAVRGTGDRLVSGGAVGDEWIVRDDHATPRRRPEGAIDKGQAIRLAGEARRIAAARGTPQDIEWAIDGDGTLWMLQARPMTALPPDVSWDAPERGAFTRQLRFGEWISEPVTPLFESWLLTTMEDRLHARLLDWVGQRAPRPYHVLVNGWYFYSLNFLSGPTFARSLPGILLRLVRTPRRVVGVIPRAVRHSISLYERDWREDLQPRYRSAVAEAEARVETLPTTKLPALIDGLADLAGDYFASIATVTGAAYKMEINLAQFYRRHVGSSLGDSHLPLLAGLEPPADPDLHAVLSLDWWHAPVPQAATPQTPTDHQRVVDVRHAAEAAAFEALARSPKRLKAFRSLLAGTQRLVPIREEQTRELTIAWPAMRRAVVRIGETLVERGAIAAPDEAFFLTRTEALAALSGAWLDDGVDVAARRATREAQARLVPPLMVGSLNPLLQRVWDSYPGLVGAVRSERALVSGTPASAGRVSGSVRVIRGASEFDSLEPGEILVAPLTAPGWTPLFTRAAAVVTDVGSPAAHASIIAREYGIPAVVGCGDATARLRTGMRVTVDGATGTVEPEIGVRSPAA